MFHTEYVREEHRIVLRFLETKKGLLFFGNKAEPHDLRKWSSETGASGSLAHAEITRIIEEGGDADTNGAIAGSLLGCKFGFNSIPNKWVENLNKKEELNFFFEELTELLIRDYEN